MDSWQEIYDSGAFEMKTREPSLVVREALTKGTKNQRILDLGCGNGRNSIYAASLGYLVDAVDEVCLDFLGEVNPETLERINFHNASVMDFRIDQRAYVGVIMTRLIQYLSLEEVRRIFDSSSKSMSGGEILMLNYTASGGSLDKQEINVRKFCHNVNEIVELLENSSLDVFSLKKGSSKSTHTNYDLPVESYDVLARKT